MINKIKAWLQNEIVLTGEHMDEQACVVDGVIQIVLNVLIWWWDKSILNKRYTVRRIVFKGLSIRTIIIYKAVEYWVIENCRVRGVVELTQLYLSVKG